MRTIDLLVQVLPGIGGWPEKVTHIGQDYDRELMFYGRGNVRTGIILDQLAVDHRKYGETGVKITREQYEAALAAKNDGWIEWGGGECPVPRGTLVDVRYRDGRQLNALSANDGTLNPRDASFVFWRNDGSEKDIIAYRLHQPQEVGQTEAEQETDLNECIGQNAAPVWGGEGKPAIGEKCEHHSGGQWEAVTIAGIYENLVTGFTDYWMVKEDGSSYTVGNPYRFRPIRPEADRKRDEAVEAIDRYMPEFIPDTPNDYYNAKKIYDAIAAGKIPGVKLED